MRIPRDGLWRPDYPHQQVWFAEHQQFLEQLACRPDHWPSADDLNQLWQHYASSEKHQTHSEKNLSFIAQEAISDQTHYYEQHIYETGQIPTREENWHDYFNALIWIQFPKTKAAINAQHVKEMAQQNELETRSRKRDALTLFDETGMILISDTESLVEAHSAHAWHTLFWKQRAAWKETIEVRIFGHGLLEKSMNPYIGMTGNALQMVVESDFFALDEQRKNNVIDQYIAEAIMTENKLSLPKEMTPLPMLGVPGWWPENAHEAFYENRDYFRPKQRR